jgi:hypothetical protein
MVPSIFSMNDFYWTKILNWVDRKSLYDPAERVRFQSSTVKSLRFLPTTELLQMQWCFKTSKIVQLTLEIHYSS